MKLQKLIFAVRYPRCGLPVEACEFNDDDRMAA